MDLNQTPISELVTEKAPTIPDHVYVRLPQMLKDLCELFPDPVKRDLFFLSSMTVISGTLPNVVGKYGDDWLTPHLYLFVIGNAGQGKGLMKFARMLGEPIQRHMAELSKFEQERFNQEDAVFQKSKKAFDKGDLDQAPTPPAPPRHRMLFIPVNNSKSGVIQLLEENDGQGILFETEGDTLADALKQDFGGFSDILRKGYHHENVDMFRRGGNEHREVVHPSIAVVLSGTPHQVAGIIPDHENGLFSRFIYYHLPDDSDFRNPFQEGPDIQAAVEDRAKWFFDVIYTPQSGWTNRRQFNFTLPQQQRFNGYFSDLKSEMLQSAGSGINGSVNRLGVIAFRIAMIFTILRDSYPCSDEDLELTLTIIDVLKEYTIDQFDRMPELATRKKSTTTPEQRMQCFNLYSMGKTISDIAESVFGELSESTRGKVYRAIKQEKKHRPHANKQTANTKPSSN